MTIISGKNVAIIGGAGFLGNHLIDQLINKNCENIVVLDNFYTGQENLLKNKKIEVQQIDSTDYQKLSEYVKRKNFDYVFDLATVPLPLTLENPRQAIQIMMKLSTNICEIARLGYIGKVTHCSSSEAYGQPKYLPMDELHPLNIVGPYGAAKAMSSLIYESYFRTFNIKMAIARPFYNYGSRQNIKIGFIPKIIFGIMNGISPVINGDGLQTRDIIHVSDTVRALILIAENEKCIGKTYNIGSGNEKTMKFLVEDICKRMNFSGSIEYGPARIGDVRRYCANVELIKNDLNFCPTKLWEEGIQETISWYQENMSNE